MARQRLAGLKAIDPAPNLGPTLTLPAYEGEVTAFSTELDNYNQQLATIDEMQFPTSEPEIKKLHNRSEAFDSSILNL